MKSSVNSIVEKIKYNFIKNSNVNFTFSIVTFLIIAILFVVQGINLGVDFTGGMVFEVKSLESDFNLPLIRNSLIDKGVKEATVQYSDNQHEIIIKLKGDRGADKVKEVFSGMKIQYDKIDYVGPQVSSELIYTGILSVVLAFLGMFLYLLFRFNWYFALSGIIALVHDVILSIGFFVVTQLEFNTSSVAAILTIIGYSINDSVVIFDRIREYIKIGKNDFAQVINKAIHSTLTRTILTSLTTMLAAIPLIILGEGTLHDFSLIILFGVFIGTYSSIFIAGPLLKFSQKSS